MNHGEMRIRAHSAPWKNGVELMITDRLGGVATEITFHDQAEGAVMPTHLTSIVDAQVLMDDLWNAGLRPTEGSGSAGSLKATERHLEDMRRLVFKKDYQIR